jgi:hypothetical protein
VSTIDVSGIGLGVGSSISSTHPRMKRTPAQIISDANFPIMIFNRCGEYKKLDQNFLASGFDQFSRTMFQKTYMEAV